MPNTTGLRSLGLLLCLAGCSGAQQVDPSADISVAAPRYPSGSGPRVMIDAAHDNYHTGDGRFRPFAELLRSDGHRVVEGAARFSDVSLADVDVLVVANASPAGGGSAFDAEEIASVVRFVERGGALLLIADHTPFPAAVSDLAEILGVRFRNVYTEDEDGRGVLTRQAGELSSDPLLEGIDQLRTFSGSAFLPITDDVRPLMRMRAGWTEQSMGGSGLSAEAPVPDGALLGAVLERGSGRVAVFAEAAMFTAQTTGGPFGERMGFHAQGAEQNRTFILAVMHWLAGA